MTANPPQEKVKAGLIGCGSFGSGIAIQAFQMDAIEMAVMADEDINAALKACELAGLSAGQFIKTDDLNEAMGAMRKGRLVVTSDPKILPVLPIDVVVEATGVAEAGAVNVLAAIANGKHVAMVNKETDSAVGPSLYERAKQKGLTYAPVDGDQHGLLIRMTRWARRLGLQLVMGGKARDLELVVSEEGEIQCHRETLHLSESKQALFRPCLNDRLVDILPQRIECLGSLAEVGNWDLVELAVAANALDLKPHNPVLCPPLFVTELPYFSRIKERAGGLDFTGAIDAFTCLRRPDEAGMGGGVFILVDSENARAKHLLQHGGPLDLTGDLPVLLTRPYHLYGVEAVQTILSVAMGGEDILDDYQQRYDVLTRATRYLPAGTIIGNDSDPAFQHFIALTTDFSEHAPIPFHLASGLTLNSDVSVGTVLTREVIVEPENSALWELRSFHRRDLEFGSP
jgi:predicted homoserine dehydrogenase-like protein